MSTKYIHAGTQHFHLQQAHSGQDLSAIVCSLSGMDAKLEEQKPKSGYSKPRV